MPTLDDNDLNLMHAWSMKCSICDQELHKNYCRQDDEFFYQGHAENCPRVDHEHDGHRTY